MGDMYVIFRKSLAGEEMFLNRKNDATFMRETAREFPTARHAYEWAKARNLLEWRVGVR